MTERVGIERVFVEKEKVSPTEERELVDLTMTIRLRNLFHSQLARMGYYVGEGEQGEINEWGEKGTIFSLFRLRDGKKTDEKVGKITTFLDVKEEE